MVTREVLGVDVGGSGIKAAPVDIEEGTLLAKRQRIVTPQPATPDAVMATIAELRDAFDWKGPIGCGFPAAVQRGIVRTASNIDDAWLGVDVRAQLAEIADAPVAIANDADVAGLAEMRFGAGKGHDGLVLVTTFGTGIGTALFTNGALVPNTELGHIEIDGEEAEDFASDAARDRDELSWKKWAKRVDVYLHRMVALFWPDLIIVGGGVSKKAHKFLPRLTVDVEVVPATLRNEAGIVGAALHAAETAR